MCIAHKIIQAASNIDVPLINNKQGQGLQNDDTNQACSY